MMDVGGGAPRFTPESLPGLIAWFDPAADYITKSGSPERVSTWVSRDANAWVLNEASGPAQPEWLPASLQGQPCLDFTAGRHIGGAAGLAALLDGSAAFNSIQVIALDGAALPNKTLWAMGNEPPSVSNENQIAYTTDAANQYANYYAQDGVGGTNNGPTATALGTTSTWYAVIHTGSAVSFEIRGAAIAGGGANTRAATCGVFSFGARRLPAGWDSQLYGKIADSIYYSRALSTTELGQLNAWIQAKYVGI